MPRNDPRLGNLPEGANEVMRDRAIRHMLYLERYKAGEVKKVIEFIDEDILPDLLDQIERRLRKIKDKGFDTGPQTTKRLEEMAAAFAQITKRFSTWSSDTFAHELTELAGDEVRFQVGVAQNAIDYDIEMTLPSPETLEHIVRARPFGGATLSQWFETLDTTTQNGLMRAVQQGLVEGQTTDQIVRRVRGSKEFGYTDGVMQTTRNKASAIVRTAVAHASNNARSELFKDNADIVSGVQWVATLDSRTTPLCASRDGKVYPVDKGPRPPAHINCRSGVIGVLKGFDEIEGLPPRTRSSMNGLVPASTTYNEWLRNQPRAIVDDALGPKRASLFLDGKLDIERFTDRQGHTLTLKQLRKRERDAFERAGVTI